MVKKKTSSHLLPKGNYIKAENQGKKMFKGLATVNCLGFGEVHASHILLLLVLRLMRLPLFVANFESFSFCMVWTLLCMVST